MSCLDATFTLTPQSPVYNKLVGDQAQLYCYGADFTDAAPTDFSSLYASNRFYFDWSYHSDPMLDYTQWSNRKHARLLELDLDLRNHSGANKQLALIFGFDVPYTPSGFGGGSINGRVQVYSDAGLLYDQQLIYGDNQFLLAIESVDSPLNLYFIHVFGSWFFRGISGYVV